MSYQSAISLTLGSLRYEAQVIGLRVRLGLVPGVNRVEATLPEAVRFEAAPGTSGTLVLTADEEQETVLSGTVRECAAFLTGRSVTLCDASVDLCSARPCATFEACSLADVIRLLANECGVTAGSIEAAIEAPVCIVDQSRSAAEHIARLATVCGSLAYIDADNRLQVPAIPGRADVALRYGRELREFHVATRTRLRPEMVAIGNGPAGSAQAPDALRPGATALPENAAAPSATVQWSAWGLLRTPAAVQTASDALNARRERALHTCVATCLLCPHLRPGRVVEVADAPDRLAGGPWIITDVVHTVNPATGAATWWRGREAGSIGPGW